MKMFLLKLLIVYQVLFLVKSENCTNCNLENYKKSALSDECGMCFKGHDCNLKCLEAQTNMTSMEFKGIYEKMHLLNKTLDDADLIKLMGNQITELNSKIDNSTKILKSSEESFNETEISNLSDTKILLNSLQAESKDFKNSVDEFEETRIDGALQVLQNTLNRTEELFLKQNEYKNRTENICALNVTLSSINELQNTTNWLKNELNQIEELFKKFPELNKEMCDEFGDPCNDKCGGAGCEKCGGVLCENGALTKSERALGNAFEAEVVLKNLKNNSLGTFESLKNLTEEVSKKLNETDGKLKDLLDFDSVKNLNTTDLITNMTNYINFLNEIVNRIEDRSNDALAVKLNVTPEELNKISEKINKTVLTFHEFDNKLPKAEDFEKLQKLENSSILLKDEKERLLENLEEVLEILDEVEDLNKNNTKFIENIRKSSKEIENDFKEITDLTDSQFSKNMSTILPELVYRTTVIEKKWTELDLSGDILVKAVENLEKNETVLNQDLEDLNEDLNYLKEFQEKLTVIQRAEAFIKMYEELSAKIEESEKELEQSQIAIQDLQTHINKKNEDVLKSLAVIEEHSKGYKSCTSSIPDQIFPFELS